MIRLFGKRFFAEKQNIIASSWRLPFRRQNPLSFFFINPIHFVHATFNVFASLILFYAATLHMPTPLFVFYVFWFNRFRAICIKYQILPSVIYFLIRVNTPHIYRIYRSVKVERYLFNLVTIGFSYLRENGNRKWNEFLPGSREFCTWYKYQFSRMRKSSNCRGYVLQNVHCTLYRQT